MGETALLIANAAATETLIQPRGLTTTEAAAAGIIMGSMITSLTIMAIIMFIITVIASWKIFKKAGEPGWKALIPFYNYYILYKIVGMKGWFWGMLAATIIFSIVMAVDGTSAVLTMTSEQLSAFDWGAHPATLAAMGAYVVLSLGVDIYYCIRTSKAFGHGGGYAAGLFFFQPIFWLILAFGSSKYNKKAALK
ncbi:hypothetical protein IKE72_02850 [Candidatus Saccharibacteria bacterium]|nr:hypothetical protein [Candidatus Saccharibacteria bacterium]